MRIERLEVHVRSCPFGAVTVRLGIGGMVKRDVVLVKLTTDDGVVGYGESHMGLNPTAIAEVIRHSMAPLVVGADPFDAEGIWDRISRHQIVTHGLGAGSVIALSGIDIALWDLRGRILGQPVYRLLGGTRKRLRAYAGGLGLGFKPPRELEREVAALLERGYTAVKLRVGDNPRVDAERVRHIRRTFGDGLDIAVDAATRYRVTDIPEVVRYCEESRVFWLEEPFTPDNLTAYRELRRATRIPIACGENHYTRQAFRDLFEARAVSIVQADCTKAGGITETKKIADMAAAYHLPIAPHTSQSVVSTAANVHLLCAVPNGLIYEADISTTNPWRDELAGPHGLKVVDGFIEPTDAPGLGLDIDEAVLERYPTIPGPSYVPPDWPSSFGPGASGP